MKYPGSDSEYRAWIQKQPSCISGTFSEYLESGEGRSIAAHVRRAKDSGTAFKAPYSCVPLTYHEHLLQHQHGESYFHPKAWWDEQVESYRKLWIASVG